MENENISDDLLKVIELERVNDEEKYAFIKVFKNLNDDIRRVEIRNEERNNINKERFNIFSCLTRHHLEELHTKFIRYLLNPKETHDCASLFLSLFIQTLCEDSDIDKSKFKELLLTLKEKNLEEAFVHDKDKYTSEGNLDICVELTAIDIVIENKIGKKEQVNQLERYVRYCKTSSSKPFIVLFLTPTGWPSNSVGMFENEYFCISYRNHILQWIEKCINATRIYPFVYPGLQYYKNLVQQKILHQPANFILMELKDLLLKKENVEAIRHLHTLKDVVTNVRNQLRYNFFTGIIREFRNVGYELYAYSLNVSDYSLKPISEADIWNSTNSGLQFRNNKYILPIERYQIRFSIEQNWENLWYGLVITTENGNRQELKKHSSLQIEEIHSKLDSKVGGLGVFDQRYYSWVSDNHDSIKVKNFAEDNNNYKLATEMDDIINRFVNGVKQYLSAWENVIAESKS